MEFPPSGWFKINTDGVSKGNPGSAGCGGILRDDVGNWVQGFGYHIGHCSAYMAELWGIFRGLQIAWKLGIKKLIVESDSYSAIQSITAYIKEEHPRLCLVHRIRDWIKKEWEVVILHTFREGNRSADWIAN